MKRILSLGLIFIFALALALSLGTGSVVLAEEETDPMFTVTLTPQEGATNILTELEDAEVGGTVLMDLYLKNNSSTSVTISAFAIELSLPSGLSFNRIRKNGSALGGSLSTEINTNTGNRAFSYFSGGEGDIVLAATGNDGDEVRLGTLTLNVGNSGLTYGDQLTAQLIEDRRYTNFHLLSTAGDEPATVVSGTVEVVTTYDIAWDDDGDSATTDDQRTQKVGIGIVPTAATADGNQQAYPGDPTKGGYSFTGWSPTVVAAAANTTYYAQWSPVAYTVSFVDAPFAEGVNVPETYDIETPITVTPTKSGCTFLGWSAAPADSTDTNYNWPAGTITDTTGYYGNVVLTALWQVNADVVFADYAYANSGDKLMMVGLSAIDNGYALFYNDDALFTTDNQYYLDLFNSRLGGGNYAEVYLYIVGGSVTASAAAADLSVDQGVNVAVQRSGDVNLSGGNPAITSGDWGIINDLLLNNSVVGVRERLEADVLTSAYDGYKFGSIDDIVQTIKIKNGTATP